MFYPSNDYRSYLAHHGVKGMKWGVRHDDKYRSDLRLRKKIGRAATIADYSWAHANANNDRILRKIEKKGTNDKLAKELEKSEWVKSQLDYKRKSYEKALSKHIDNMRSTYNVHIKDIKRNKNGLITEGVVTKKDWKDALASSATSYIISSLLGAPIFLVNTPSPSRIRRSDYEKLRASANSEESRIKAQMEIYEELKDLKIE